jgi:putative tryptophan/tyrosine transport system permease protein
MEFYLTAVLQGLCLSVMALGVYISMKIFNIPDITTDGSFTLGAAITAVCLSAGHSPFLALPLAILAGTIAGACTGLIHTRLGVPPLLAGILVMTGLYSVNLAVMGRSNIPLVQTNSLLDKISATGVALYDQGLVILIFVGAFVVLLQYLLRTDFGLAMRATGNSESMIRALGVNTTGMKILGLGLANALTATSGYLMAQLQGFADINMGIGIVIAGLGSVAIGDTFVQRLKIPSMTAILLMMLMGAILFQLALAFALSAGIDTVWLKLLTAVIVLLMVSFSRISGK